MKSIKYIFGSGVLALATIALGGNGCGADGFVSEPTLKLLDLAYSSVSEMPLDPHIKNRSREQYKVVGAALELDQPDRAAQYAKGIAYWQQGAALADLALYEIEQGNEETGRKFLSEAESWLADASDKFQKQATEQSWRLSRVATQMAMAYTALGENGKVKALLPRIESGDAAKLLRHKLTQTTAETFDASLDALSTLADRGELGGLKDAADGFTQLYTIFYTNTVARKAIEEKIQTYQPKLPYLYQIDWLVRLGEIALDHNDSPTALNYADQTERLLEQRTSPSRFRIPQTARWAALRGKAGDVASAKRALMECLQQFKSQRKKITNIDRAGILCPVAEGYAAIGDRDAALDVYAQAIIEGQINPNSRPRASDLNRICLSMARHNIAPSKSVFQSLEEMNEALGSPW